MASSFSSMSVSKVKWTASRVSNLKKNELISPQWCSSVETPSMVHWDCLPSQMLDGTGIVIRDSRGCKCGLGSCWCLPWIKLCWCVCVDVDRCWSLCRRWSMFRYWHVLMCVLTGVDVCVDRYEPGGGHQLPARQGQRWGGKQDEVNYSLTHRDLAWSPQNGHWVSCICYRSTNWSQKLAKYINIITPLLYVNH